MPLTTEPTATTAIPSAIRCPITLNLMWSPVTTTCGHNFSRNAIEGWINSTGNGGVAQCPLCRYNLVEEDLRPNEQLAQQVRQFHVAHPEINPWANEPAGHPVATPAVHNSPTALPTRNVQVQAPVPVPVLQPSILSNVLTNAFKVANKVAAAMPNFIQHCVKIVTEYISSAIGTLMGIFTGISSFFSGQAIPAPVPTTTATAQNTPAPAVVNRTLHPAVQISRPKPIIHPLGLMHMAAVENRARINREKQARLAASGRYTHPRPKIRIR